MNTSIMEQKLSLSAENFSKFLLAKGPVFWSEVDKFWVVTDYEIAQQVLKSVDYSADRSKFFMSRLGNLPMERVQNFFSVVQKMMVTSDPPDHTARRKLASFGLNDQVLDAFAPAVEKTIRELISKARAKKNFEFVQDIALPLPCIVLADLFSIPAERRSEFYHWSNSMTQFFGGASEDIAKDATAADEGAAKLFRYFTQLIDERRANPQNDFFSRLLANQASVGLNDAELISQACILLVAGTVTTSDQLSNALNEILGHPQVVASLKSDLSLVENALEEATRLDPSVNFLFRVSKKSQLLGNREINTGELVFISVHACNRNEKLFAQPHTFSLDRAKNLHLSYGHGIHYCLGARLGRIQMKAALQELFRIGDIQFDPRNKPTRKHQSLAFSGFERMPLQV